MSEVKVSVGPTVPLSWLWVVRSSPRCFLDASCFPQASPLSHGRLPHVHPSLYKDTGPWIYSPP